MEEKGVPHMCDMAGKKESWQEMKKAAADARWICAACGRAAAEKERLCAPESFATQAGAAPAERDCCGN